MIEHQGDVPIKPRNQEIEILRVLAAYGVVAYHAQVAFYDLAYSGLVVFLILLTYVDCTFNWDTRRSAISLAKVFIMPWLIWMVIYAAWSLRAHKPILNVHPWIAGLLSGTAPHLWFMPAGWAVLVCLNQLKGRISPGLLVAASGILATGLLATAPLWHACFPRWTPPFPQWLHATPALLFGIVLGLAGRVPKVILLPTVAVLATACASLLISPIPGITIPYVVGGMAVLLAIWTGPRIAWGKVNVRPLSACMLGVYLSHPLGLAIIGSAIGKHSWTTVNLTFVSMLAATWLAQRYVPFASLAVGRPEFWLRRATGTSRSRSPIIQALQMPRDEVSALQLDIKDAPSA